MTQLSVTTNNTEETIYVNYKDGSRATFTGSDLSARWTKVFYDTDVQAGDYYKPGKTKPRLDKYFGNFTTTLPL